MGRLVEPITKEQYDKLPVWQKWSVDHPNYTLTLITIGLLCLAGLMFLISYYLGK